jgi:hypothetical protein
MARFATQFNAESSGNFLQSFDSVFGLLEMCEIEQEGPRAPIGNGTPFASTNCK